MLPEFLIRLPGRFCVYLARHAMPDRARAEIPYSTPPGPPLTPQGLEEAASLGAFLREAGVPLVQASPFERTLRTATIAAGVAGAALEVHEDLSEWRPGEVEPEVAARMRRALLAAARRSAQRGRPVAVVTHGGPVLALLKLLGVPGGALDALRIYDYHNPLPTAAAWRVEREDDDLRVDLPFLPPAYHYPASGAPRFAIPLPTPLPFPIEELPAD